MADYPLNIQQIRALRDLEAQESAYEAIDSFLSKSLSRMQQAIPAGNCRDQFTRSYRQFTTHFLKKYPNTYMFPPNGPIYYGMHSSIFDKLPARCYPSKFKINPKTVELVKIEAERRIAFSSQQRNEVYEDFFPEKERGFELDPSIRLDFIYSFRKMSADYIDSLRGMQSFYRLIGVIFEDNRAKEILKDRKLTTLIPGGGSHLAPLQVAFGLIDKKAIDRAKFIYTEINPNYLERIDAQLQQLQRQGVIHDYRDANIDVRSCPQECSGRGTETEFNFTYQGKPIQILFALDRVPQQKDRPQYWLPEYARETDLVIFHDLGLSGENFNKYNRLIYQLSRDKDPLKPQLVLGEEREIYFWDEDRGYFITTIRGRYGHGFSQFVLPHSSSEQLGFRKYPFCIETSSHESDATLILLRPDRNQHR